MNELPGSWEVAALDDLLAPQDDGRTIHQGWSPQCDKQPAGENEWGALKTTAIQPGQFQQEHNKRLPSEKEPRPGLEVRKGDVLLTCAGPRCRCGIACLVRETRSKLMISGKMYRFRFNPDHLDARYIALYLQSNTAWKAIDEMKTGVSDSGLNLTQGRIRTLPVPVPPLPEQRRIVAAIEEHFSRLDAAEDGVRRVSERIAGFGRQMLSEILGVRSAPHLDDDIPTEPLPAGWAWRRAGDVCAGVVSGSTPESVEMTQGEGDVPFIKVYNVQFDGSLDFTIKPTFVSSEVHRSKLKRSVVAPGDVLTNIVGPPLGKMSVVPNTYPEWNINQAIAAFKPSAEIDGSFLSRLMLADLVMRPLLRTGKATAGQINLSISSCRRVWLPVPPIGEQRRLVSEIDAALSLCDQLHRESRLAQSRSRSLRRSILAAAFSGRLVPQDPADEPASVLLERIAAERPVAKPSRRKKAAS